MQATLAFLNMHIFKGLDGSASGAAQDGHDYDDEYAAFMDAFDRIDLEDDSDDGNGDMDPPPPQSTPSDQNDSQEPDIVVQPTGLEPAGMAEPDTTQRPRVPIDNSNGDATAGPSRPRGRKQVPPVVAIESPVQGEGYGELDCESSVPKAARPKRTGGAKAKGKGKGKA
jgi:hypothetical protein